MNISRLFYYLLWGALMGMPLTSMADQSDQEQARRAMLAGDILPLQTILLQLEQTHPGTVIEVELDDEDDGWVYEIKLLRPNGRVTKLELDAKTGQILKEKNK